MAVTYFKAFDCRLKCRDMKYKVGKIFTMPDDPETGFPDIRVCSSGFHCCNRLFAVYDYYPTSATTRICVVKPGGIIRYRRHDGYRKLACSLLEIVQELSFEEVLDRLMEEMEAFEAAGDHSAAYRVSMIIDLLRNSREAREKRLRNYRINFGVRVRKK